MSGSPVIYRVGEFLEFMGIYSGRYGKNDLGDAQLGRVWRVRILEEILTEGSQGIASVETPEWVAE